MSYIIHLSDEQFEILRNLVNEGMEVTLSPYDNIDVDPQVRFQIEQTLSAVAFFNSHALTHHV